MDANTLPDFHLFPYKTETEPHSVDNDEKLILSKTPISLKTSSSWTYCGPLLSLDPNDLPPSFEAWTNATLTGSPIKPLFSFLEFVHGFLTKNHISHYWITIRADKPSSEFDTPRWHTDDLFFSPQAHTSSRGSPITKLASITRQKRSHPEPENNNYQIQIKTSSPNPPNWKLTTTLLGPGTLFIAPSSSSEARTLQRDIKRSIRAESPAHLCASVRCQPCTSTAESVRVRLAEELKGYEVVQAQPGECAFFRVGEKEGAVHSEPAASGDRIFVNVVPGVEADLRCLMAKWGMVFPRAWCVGLPFLMSRDT